MLATILEGGLAGEFLWLAWRWRVGWQAGWARVGWPSGVSCRVCLVGDEVEGQVGQVGWGAMWVW